MIQPSALEPRLPEKPVNSSASAPPGLSLDAIFNETMPSVSQQSNLAPHGQAHPEVADTFQLFHPGPLVLPDLMGTH